MELCLPVNQLLLSSKGETLFNRDTGQQFRLTLRSQPVPRSQSTDSSFSPDLFPVDSDFEDEMLSLDPEWIIAQQGKAIQTNTSFTTDRPTTPPPPIESNRAQMVRYLNKWLLEESPFMTKAILSDKEDISFKKVFEITRVALYSNVSYTDLADCVAEKGSPSYEGMWTAMSELVESRKAPMPSQSNAKAWHQADHTWKGISQHGKLKLATKANVPLFKFELSPMSLQSSHRFARKYGGDRFFELDVPWIDSDNLEFLTLPKDKHSLEALRSVVMEWVYRKPHYFLNRYWRAFFTKPNETKIRRAKRDTETNSFRVYLFAETGLGISSQQESDIGQLLKWFMPAQLNLDQPLLKFFARIQLGLSRTTPTVVFNPNQIIRTRNAFSKYPARRSLENDCNDSKKLSALDEAELGEVMNDGCARISRKAHQKVAQMLGLAMPYPAAFQARIGGAKGMWMLDLIDDKTAKGDDFWIEISDSQLKFEFESCEDEEDAHHRTFEVLSSPSAVRAANLNSQLITILADRGVSHDSLEELMHDYTKAEVDAFQAALDNPLAMSAWIRQKNKEKITGGRLEAETIDMVGGMPKSIAERIISMVEAGFEPRGLHYLRQLCQTEFTVFCTKLLTRLSIHVGQSTNAIILADPLGILEENEIHVGFSTAFVDTKSQFDAIALDQVDVLVARLPALLPSDVQKVRAVYKLELAQYRDVIVFSSKGSASLASKLSGGDHDGDTAWLCWDSKVVGPFQNVSPPCIPDLNGYGITKDPTKVRDIFSNHYDWVQRFLVYGLDFNTRPTLIGIATNYREYMCYYHSSLTSRQSINLAGLLGHLVDAPKGGLTFTSEDFRKWKKNNGLPQSFLEPAYRKGRPPREPSTNILDKLTFNIVHAMANQAKQEFREELQAVASYDITLSNLYKEETARMASDTNLKPVFTDLSAQLDNLVRYYKSKCPSGEELENADAKLMAYRDASINTLRARFISIQPLATSTHPMTRLWREDSGSMRGAWAKLKASALYYRHHRLGPFPWYACGEELCELKAQSEGKARRVVERVYLTYKSDGKMVKGLGEKRKREDDDEGEDCGSNRPSRSLRSGVHTKGNI